MGEIITQLGVGGIFAIMIIKMVFDFIKEKKNGKIAYNPAELNNALFTHVEDQKIEYKLARETNETVRWLKDIHNVKDEDGIPVWYVRRSLEDAMLQLSKNIAAQTKILERLIIEFQHLNKDK